MQMKIFSTSAFVCVCVCIKARRLMKMEKVCCEATKMDFSSSLSLSFQCFVIVHLFISRSFFLLGGSIHVYICICLF